MFILKDVAQLEKAIVKAKQFRPRVEFDRFGRYRVSGSKGGFYTVTKQLIALAKAAKKGWFAITPYLH
jgi:hypothetical protein